MESMLPVDVLSRWIHIGTVIVLVGGSAFMRFALMPAAAELPEDQHQALKERIFSRWRKIVMCGIGLILISGLYNYVRAIPLHKGQGIYHGLIGTKMILAFVLFFLASALTGRSEKFEPIRQNSKKWLGILLLLAAIIVAISGYAKVAIPKKGEGGPAMVPSESLLFPRQNRTDVLSRHDNVVEPDSADFAFR